MFSYTLTENKLEEEEKERVGRSLLVHIGGGGGGAYFDSPPTLSPLSGRVNELINPDRWERGVGSSTCGFKPPPTPSPNFQKHARRSSFPATVFEKSAITKRGGTKISSPVHLSQIGRQEKRGKERKGTKVIAEREGMPRLIADRTDCCHSWGGKRAVPRTLSHSAAREK